MKKEITIKKEWFERLKELINLLSENVGDDRLYWIEHLKGYVSSLDYLFEDEK